MPRLATPRSITSVVIQADLFKARCLQTHANPLAEHEVRKFLEGLHLEERHFNYRYYAIFGGYIPTYKWIISP